MRIRLAVSDPERARALGGLPVAGVRSRTARDRLEVLAGATKAASPARAKRSRGAVRFRAGHRLLDREATRGWPRRQSGVLPIRACWAAALDQRPPRTSGTNRARPIAPADERLDDRRHPPPVGAIGPGRPRTALGAAARGSAGCSCIGLRSYAMALSLPPRTARRLGSDSPPRGRSARASPPSRLDRLAIGSGQPPQDHRDRAGRIGDEPDILVDVGKLEGHRNVLGAHLAEPCGFEQLRRSLRARRAQPQHRTRCRPHRRQARAQSGPPRGQARAPSLADRRRDLLDLGSPALPARRDGPSDIVVHRR